MQRQMLKGACNYCIQFTQRNLVKLLIIANSLKYKIRPTLEHQLLVQPKGAMISFGIITKAIAHSNQNRHLYLLVKSQG